MAQETIDLPVAGQPISASGFGAPAKNNIEDHETRIASLENFSGIQVCHLFMSGSPLESVASGDTYIPSFNNATYEIVDTESWHDVSTNPDRVTVTKKGLYQVNISSEGYWSSAPTTGSLTISATSTLTEVSANTGKISAIPWTGYSNPIVISHTCLLYNPSDASAYIRLYLYNSGTSKTFNPQKISMTVVRLSE